ncbi:asialoglycoprotein receptor 1-like [Hippocampus comes]|uniref:asialoglycoprotein receptor 1-like n=1 Tax=Hippocampus comes TaxID=109280 RepID=UPI00094ECC5D|nr:PREDICTED: asialoglycoprotein receptor 1-like [Hippocampus comes]
MDNWSEEAENVSGKQVDDAAAPSEATEAAGEDTVDAPKSLSGKSMEMSVLYDAPDKEEASKIQVGCCVPGRGFCCLLGLVFMLLSIVTGWFINHSKLEQLKQQLSSLEENNLLVETLIEMVQRTPGRVDYLLEQDQQLRERLNALDEAKVDIRVLQNASLQIDALQLFHQQVDVAVNLLKDDLAAVKRAVQDRQELLSDKLEEQLATLYANFCGTPEERGHPIRCCKEGWVKNASHCYWLSERIRSWEGARKHCVAKNSLLVRIDDFEVQKFLTHLINQSYWESVNDHLSDEEKREKITPVWIGLSDQETEGNFMWVDGSPLSTPVFWRPREPNNMAQRYVDNVVLDSDCVVMRFDPTASDLYNSWDDQLCRGKRLYFCRACIFCNPPEQPPEVPTKPKRKKPRLTTRSLRQEARLHQTAALHPTCSKI